MLFLLYVTLCGRGDDFTSIVTGFFTYFDAIILNIKNTTQLHSSRKPRTPTYVAAQPWQ